MKIALTGASGFLGARILERWVLTGAYEVVPVLRGFGSAAPVSRFPLRIQYADARDKESLAKAFAGCDAVVHAALGDPQQIVDMAGAVYDAAESCGITRLVALSSAVSLGMVIAKGSDENSPVKTHRPLDYCSAKGVAETILTHRSLRGRCKVIQLRPFTIYGPRSSLVARILKQLQNESAWLLNGGSGTCNAVYVDNVIHAIEQALSAPANLEGVYHLNDDEVITWRGFYEALATQMGLSVPVDYPEPLTPRPDVGPSLPDRVKIHTSKPLPQAVFRHVPERAKRMVKALITAWPTPFEPNIRALPDDNGTEVDAELYQLQQNTWRLSTEKAQRELDYLPPVSQQEGIRRTVAWYQDVNGS